jgi:long-subunit fatty acid transport protein
MLARALAAALVAAAASWTSSARALDFPTVYDNAQGIPIGSRAAGMGGAYTALACDEAALHYNPASLSCAPSSHLELTANAYVLQGALARGELGPGEDVAAVKFHSIPSIVGAVRIVREGAERTRFATYPGRLAFGFTVSVPSSVALQIDPPHPNERNYAAFSVRDDLTCGDLGLAYQVNREIAVGASIGGVMRTAEQHASWLVVRGQSTLCPAGHCADYLAYDVSRAYLAIGLRFKAGVLFRPIKNFSFGLNLTAPTLHVYGSAKENATLTRADGGGFTALPIRASGSSHVDLPLRMTVGMAYVKKRYTFTGDVSLNFPRQVEEAHDMKADRITGVAATMVADRTMQLTFQPNVNIGASVPFGPEKELNIGFFTDFSSVSPTDVTSRGADRVHMLGGSMTLGLLGKQSRVWVGTSGEIGHTTTHVPGRAFSYEQVSPLPAGALPAGGDATLVRWTLVGILGSNYSFLD